MNKLYLTVGFILGAAFGAGVTYYLLNDRYEALMNEELEARRREAAEERKEKKKEEVKEEPAEGQHIKRPSKPNIMEYAAKLQEEGYKNYSKADEPEIKKEPAELPYVISPDTVLDEPDYDSVSYVYYADGILADETDEIVEDIGDILPEDFADHFGDYSDDSDTVYIRDDARRIIYDICQDDRTYEEVSGKKPPRVEIK